jgi:Protein of unknown function (DUF2971)
MQKAVTFFPVGVLTSSLAFSTVLWKPFALGDLERWQYEAKMNDIIYRYRSFNKYSIEELVNSEFYIKLPNEVNDPFDSKCIFDEMGTEADFRKHHMLCLKKQRPDLSDEQIRQEVDVFIESNQWRDREFTEDLFKSFREDTSEKFSKLAMVCFSKKNDDILMWSHYADEHKGFCLIFDRARLEASCHAPLYDMSYNRKKFGDLMEEDVIKIAQKLVLTKSKDWCYEKEVRMIIPIIPGKTVYGIRNARFMKYSEEALIGVIFGCRMPYNDKSTIKKLLSSKITKPDYYDAINCAIDYKLKIEKHSY